jgi:hypothetical protein
MRVSFTRLLASILSLTFTQVANAELKMFSCDAPRGWRVDYMSSNTAKGAELETGEDGFSGTKPIFILDSSDKKTLTEIVDPLKPEGISPEFIDSLFPDKVRRYRIVLWTAHQVSAVDVGEQSVWTTSIYPALGVVIITRVSHDVWPGKENAVGATYHAVCKVSLK